MIHRRLLFVVGCIAIAFAIAYGNGTAVRGDHNVAAKNEQNVDLKDKIVVLEITEGSGLNSESDSAVLANARVVKIGNRDFIIGDAFPVREDDDDWHKEVTDGIPCDNIVRFRSMTPERFKSYAKKWAEQTDEE
jgi:hypothetical protein